MGVTAMTPAALSAEPAAAPITSPLITARGLGLTVPVVTPQDRSLFANPARLLSDLYFSRGRRGTAVLIEDVSFTLAPGERLGLIGGNGAGKSTLLRVLAGIYQPTAGQLRVHGTARGLFDISLGMHPEATGLENIYMRGLQMGLGLQEIRSLIPAVLEFSELGEHIDKRLSTFSTGMRLRLAIAVSTMIEPDILLLDEWIGAGDKSFSDKVTARMMRLVEGSRGLVIATHNIGLMRSLCTHGLVLKKGRVVFSGDVSDAYDFYVQDLKPKG
jgi:ABC-type polysaccharide/polyol phosphate transport system ATPase subunit